MQTNINLRYALVVVALGTLAACGGSGGGDGSGPSSASSAMTSSQTFAFAGENSDIVAVVPGTNARPAMVLMRGDGSAVERIAFVQNGAEIGYAEVGSDGQIDNLYLGGHRLEYGDFGQETVPVTHYDPSGGVVGYMVPRQDANASSGNENANSRFAGGATSNRQFRPSQQSARLTQEELDQLIDDTIQTLANPFETYLPLIILNNAAQTLSDLFNRARETVDDFRDSASQARQTISNAWNCLVDDSECASVAAADAEDVIASSREADPSGMSTASFEITGSGTRANESEWRDDDLNGDFDPETGNCRPFFQRSGFECPSEEDAGSDNSGAGTDDLNTGGGSDNADPGNGDDGGAPGDGNGSTDDSGNSGNDGSNGADDGGASDNGEDDDGGNSSSGGGGNDSSSAGTPAVRCSRTDHDGGYRVSCFSERSAVAATTRFYSYAIHEGEEILGSAFVCDALGENDSGFPTCVAERRWRYSLSEEVRSSHLLESYSESRTPTSGATFRDHLLLWEHPGTFPNTPSVWGKAREERFTGGDGTRCFYSADGSAGSFRTINADRETVDEGAGCPLADSPGNIGAPPSLPESS